MPFQDRDGASVLDRPDPRGVVERGCGNQLPVRTECRPGDSALMPDQFLQFGPVRFQQVRGVVAGRREDEIAVRVENNLPPTCPDSGDFGTSRRVPQPCGAESRTRRQEISFRTELNLKQPDGGFEPRDLASARNVPDENSAREGCSCNATSVGAERRIVDDFACVELGYLTAGSHPKGALWRPRLQSEDAHCQD